VTSPVNPPPLDLDQIAAALLAVLEPQVPVADLTRAQIDRAQHEVPDDTDW
jgi:hypothetical protein